MSTLCADLSSLGVDDTTSCLVWRQAIGWVPGSFEGSGLMWPSRGDGCARPGVPWTGKLREISFAEELLKVMFIEHPPGPTLRGEGTEWACAAGCPRMSVPGFIHFEVESGSAPMPVLC